MDLEEFEIKQLKAVLEAEGMRLILSYEKFQEIKDFILDKGTLLFLEDKDAFVLGDGINPIENLSLLPLEEQEEEEVPENLPELEEENQTFLAREVNPLTIKTAEDLWQNLENVCPFKMLSYALPSPLLEEFINQKPDNFTFFLGEEVPLESPLKNFLEKFPNLAGLFMRNYNHGSGVDPNGNRDFTKIQEDSFVHHRHNFLIKKIKMFSTVIKDTKYKPSYSSFSFENPIRWEDERVKGIMYEKGDMETRPLNFSNLFFMRTY